MYQSPAGWFHAHNATIVGDVTIGPESSLWFNVIVRGDVAPVRIGQRVNIQDAAIVHCDKGVTNMIEDDVSIAHGAIVHGAFVGQGSLIGIGAKILGRARIGRQCLVAAGAVVPPGLEVPDRMVVMGIPGKIVRPVKEEELVYFQRVTQTYMELARQYVEGRSSEIQRK